MTKNIRLIVKTDLLSNKTMFSVLSKSVHIAFDAERTGMATLPSGRVMRTEDP